MRASLTSDPSERFLVTVGCAVIVAVVTGYFVLVQRMPSNASLPVGVAALLIALSVPVIRRTARLSDDPWAIWLLSAGLATKLLATLVRYWINNDLYNGSADANIYHVAAQTIADGIRHGIWSLDGTPVQGRAQESAAAAWVLGIVYSVLGSVRMVGYLVFSWIGWLGLICFYRAFRISFPEVRSRACLLLLAFLPSLVYWPSSPGKEALITTFLGLATLGLAHLLMGRSITWGVASLVAGLAGILWIRPHIAMLLLVATLVAVIVRRPGKATVRNRLGRAVILALLVPVLFVGLGRVSDLFGADNKTETVTIGSVFEQTRTRTTTGGSQFETRPVRSPLDFPPALGSVLLRPFVWESPSGTRFVASIEGVLFAVVVLARPKTIGRMLLVMCREPMGAFCAAYTVAFVIAFSNVGNAGILVRQRTQLLPIVALLLAATADRQASTDERDDQLVASPESPNAWMEPVAS